MLSLPTRAELRAIVRRQLADPNGRWWSDAELNDYLHDWAIELQQYLEFVKGTSTVVTTSSVLQFPTEAGATGHGRVERLYRNGRLLVFKTTAQLGEYDTRWKLTAGVPWCWYQETAGEARLWPANATSATYRFEFQRDCTYSNDTERMKFPAWCRYSAVPYACWWAYNTYGPNHDLRKAARWQKRWMENFSQARLVRDAYFPHRAPTLKPGDGKELRKIEGEDPMALPIVLQGPFDIVPTGVVNGTNTVFTLPYAPYKMWFDINGLGQNPSSDYTLVDNVITCATAPWTGSVLRAQVWREV